MQDIHGLAASLSQARQAVGFEYIRMNIRYGLSTQQCVQMIHSFSPVRVLLQRFADELGLRYRPERRIRKGEVSA